MDYNRAFKKKSLKINSNLNNNLILSFENETALNLKPCQNCQFFIFDIAWTTYISIFRPSHPRSKIKAFTLSDPLIVSVLEQYKVYCIQYTV